jgi:hypothetical protein
MDPNRTAWIRLHWQPLFAVLLTAALLLVHVTVFLPYQRRLAVADAKARSMGMAFDPDAPSAPIPPRVIALVAANSLPAGEAQRRGSSGALTADLFDAISGAANRAGVSILATEPGVTLQQEQAVQVRAHVRASCRAGQFLKLLDEFARGDALITIDRFSLVQAEGNRLQLELWLTRHVLKQNGGRP